MNLHKQAYQYIIEKIKSNEWKIGDQIPAETELAETLNISRPTIRQALSQLVSEGYLIRCRGKGSFVAQPKLSHTYTSFLSSYRKESEKENRTIHTEVISQEVIRANAKIADKLQIAKGKKVTMLTRLRYVMNYNDNKPVLLTSVYIPFHKFPDMLEHDFTQISLYDLLEQRNLFVKQATRELEVILPDQESKDLLKLNRFEPVIFISSIGTLENSIPIEYSESMYPADISRFTINVTREEFFEP